MTAGGVVRPVAIGTGHAPFHAPTRSDHAAVLDDGVMHHAPFAIRGKRAGTAEPPRNGVVGPRPEGDLPDIFEPYDLKRRLPKPPFLARKARLNLPKRESLVAQRDRGVIARAAEAGVHLEPVGRLPGTDPGTNQQRRRGCQAHHASTTRVTPNHGTPPTELNRTSTAYDIFSRCARIICYGQRQITPRPASKTELSHANVSAGSAQAGRNVCVGHFTKNTSPTDSTIAQTGLASPK